MRIQDAIGLLRAIKLTDYSSDYNEAMGIAIYELSKLIPRQPANRSDGFGCREAVCPNCKAVVYHSDWTERKQRKMFDNHCHICCQGFTPTSRYLGEWEKEKNSE